jgi:threonine synthase
VRYRSTRRADDPGQARFCDILLEGLAPDGGLYWPVSWPRLDRSDLAELRRVLAQRGYAGLAQRVLGLFCDDIPAADLERICQRAYTTEKFGGPDIVPVSALDGQLRLAHLSNGPTAAFKDLAMQLLAELFEYELTRRDRRLTILGATSGDTGSAAEQAMLGQSRVKVFMLSPQGRMTAFQRGQMYGLDDPGIVNLTVPGSFDDCQDLVKAVNADAELKADLDIGAVNSINWARLAAQVVYYVACWLKVSRSDDQPVSLAVPTGNFGNIVSGHIARRLGVPIDRLVLATNENDVLAEFFDSGVYRVRSSAQTVATSSPSMDISKASNFERFVFDLLDGDAQEVARLFGQVLPTSGQIDLSGRGAVARSRDDFGFWASRSTHADRLAAIAATWRDCGRLIDPHTADGVTAGRRLVGPEPMVCLETALPIKFADTMVEAVGFPAPVPDRFANVLTAPSHAIELTGGLDQLKCVLRRLAV